MYGEGNMGGGFRPRGGPDGFAPVKVGEELDVRIEAVGEKGDGIARKRGFVLFIPNTHEGDEVRIRITKVLRKVGFADVIGQAQSTPPADTAPAPRRDDRPMAQPIPPAPSPEDTEDFGEELEEESAEEPVKDEPVDKDIEVPPVPDGEDVGDEHDEDKKEE